MSFIKNLAEDGHHVVDVGRIERYFLAFGFHSDGEPGSPGPQELRKDLDRCYKTAAAGQDSQVIERSLLTRTRNA